ncbi:MAG TPA: electron transfer flavoprotein subunit beta/FixA family protein [Candidatus Sulfobium mesophilum]|nr:electron transfer flavoprotein subunit beta/FixA family protein [Candidatus Sulfobium mesophilum]
MKIVVCVKQVPDTAEVRINPETNTLIRDGVQSIINPYDMHAIEAGLQIREKAGGTVTVVTMGPPQAENALREAISMGVDNAVLLTDRAFAGSDTWSTAYALSKAIEYLGADVILCGKQAIDGDTAQVGPEIAEFLDIPHVAYIRKIDNIQDNKIIVQRLMDEGFDIIEASLPVLLTVVRELNVPRMPSLKGKIAAKKADIKKLSAADIRADENSLGLKGSPTQVRNIFAPDAKKDRKMIEGTTGEIVDVIVKELVGLKCL